ncbi:ribosomal protein L11 methyltransferase [Stieleria neptunia]|uniref:Ribosomal protein L11 methyltransferase n=2 Tax=Stieleria neptunia TaxID=2527979 RepID=A0A518HLY6_9BACT|nr:ribosomal protein L11 methyltransferase [Stieleria neptunia]
MMAHFLLFVLVAAAILAEPCFVEAAEPAQSSEDTAIHVPTPPDIVDKMLELARVSSDDLLYDLGCGDGRIVIAAASTYRCRAVGYDIDARKVKQSKDNVKRHKLETLVQIKQQDIFKLDLREASVITLYLLPEMNDRLVPQLKTLKDGSRIVCHQFPFEGIRYDRMITVKSTQDGAKHDIYLYTLPFDTVRPPQASLDRPAGR